MTSNVRTPAHGILIAVMLCIVAPEASAIQVQTGRTETSRSTGTTAVARGTSKQKVVARDSQKSSQRRPEGALKEGSRVKKSGRVVQRRSGGGGSDLRSGRRAGGSTRGAGATAGVQSDSRGTVRNGRGVGARKQTAGGRRAGTRDRRVESGERNRSLHSGGASTRKGRTKRQFEDRARHRPSHKAGRAANRVIYRHHRHHLAQFAWCTAYHPAGHYHYADARINIGSHIYIGVRWPWVHRSRHWRPRYRYRQVVHVHAGWGSRARDNQVDVRTYYRHRVLHADDRYAEVQIEIDAIELYQNDRYLGTLDRIPEPLKNVRATVYADGRIDFDRNIFIVGDARAGFEVLATRYYDDYLYNAYDSRDGYRVGYADLRRGEVRLGGRSRLFAPGRFEGLVPISLLPDDERLWDYGRSYIDGPEDRGFGDSGWYRSFRDRGFDDEGSYDLSRRLDVDYVTPQGAQVRVESSTYLDRLD